MLGNLAAILILERDFDSGEKFVFNNKISTFLDVMEKSENKLVRKNGVRALAIFSAKRLGIKIHKQLFVKLTEFLRDMIVFDSDVDNILNSLTVLAKSGRVNWLSSKNERFLVQLISLLRFLNHLKLI